MPSSLNSRLARMERLLETTKSKQPPPPPTAPPEVKPELEGLVQRDYPAGSILCKDSFHPAGEPFGDYDIDWDFTGKVSSTLPGFLADAAGSKPRDWAFVDCETTGLSGGTGTLAFLVAVGRPLADSFTIRQFFLSEPADEQGMLQAIEESLAGVQVLWSYNGKCFDLPLLETRFRFWRMAFQRDNYRHVDLLYPTRILYRSRIGACNLGNLEEQILKVARSEDLPGAEVPQVYFEYLQTGRSPRLHRVFEHNRVDVLSLAVYAAHLLKVFDPRMKECLTYPEDVLSLTRYYIRRREWAQGRACLEDARRFILGEELTAEYHRHAASLFKRCGEYEQANTHFEELTRSPVADNVQALVELAKHFEHRPREIKQALKLTEQAITLVKQATYFANQYYPDRLNGLYHRRARLRRKLQTHPVQP